LSVCQHLDQKWNVRHFSDVGPMDWPQLVHILRQTFDHTKWEYDVQFDLWEILSEHFEQPIHTGTLQFIVRIFLSKFDEDYIFGNTRSDDLEEFKHLMVQIAEKKLK
jgi:hypothetical protein